MAVIRTRKDSDTSGEAPPSGASVESTPVVVPTDRTKSVVRTPAPVVRAPRTPGRAQMPGGAPLATSNSDSRSFIKDTIVELKRVVWPSKEDVMAGTVVTIGLLLFFSFYIFGLDYLAESFFKALGFYK